MRLKDQSTPSAARRTPKGRSQYALACAALAAAVALAFGTALAQTPAAGTLPPQTPSTQASSPAQSREVVQGNMTAAANTGIRLATSPQLTEALQRRGDLTLRDSSLQAALFTINELWKVNIVGPRVEGQVNGVFKNAPLKEILDTILLGNGYGYRMVGESIVVSKLELIGQINPFFVSEAVHVSSVKPSEVVEAAKLLSTPQGKVNAVDAASTLIVVDFPERVKMIRDLVASIDAASGGPGMLDASGRPKPLDVLYYHTQYITVADAKKVLSTILSTAGRVESIDGEDRMLVVDFAENLQMVDRVLKQVDRPRPQVQITALIYDISLEDLETLGVNWGANGSSNRVKFGTNQESSLGFGSILTEPLLGEDGATSGTGSSFNFVNLSTNLDLSLAIEAIQNANDSRLLANPNVTVMDNEAANFEAVQEIPYQQLTQTSNGGNLGTTAFKDAGIKLDVTPKIATDGTIELIVRPEFSSLNGFTPNDNQPIINTRSTSTTVRIANGQTLVIGGMRQRTDVGSFSGVPGVKDVRFIGHLFRSRSTNIRESELVVFITPKIVGYSDPLDCRNQIVRDTVDCRLDRIPRAEGCPPGCGPCHGPNYPPGDCGEYPLPYEAVPYGPTPHQAPYEADSYEANSPAATNSPTANGPSSELVQPMQVPPRQSGGDLPTLKLSAHTAPQAPTTVRRLPTAPDAKRNAAYEGLMVAGASQADPADITPIPAANPQPVIERFPPNYDSRFRDTGTLSRRQPSGGDTQPEVQQAKAKPSWWDRVLLR